MVIIFTKGISEEEAHNSWNVDERMAYLNENLFMVGVGGVKDVLRCGCFVALGNGDICNNEPGVVAPSVSTSPSMTQSRGTPIDH